MVMKATPCKDGDKTHQPGSSAASRPPGLAHELEALCANCGGDGKISVPGPGPPWVYQMIEIDCPACKGTGKKA